MNQHKSERMKADIKNALCEVFKKRGLSFVIFTKIYISPDHHYVKVEIDTLMHDVDEFLLRLHENPLYSDIIKDLHKYLKVSFPKIVFAKDSHKDRIEMTEKLLESL